MEKVTPLISVIVPVYNVEDYLEECLESIVNQTYQNLEIILVNDGSTDKSPQICQNYANKDKRVLVYQKQNGGLSDARNYGLERARGAYISFVDSDDLVSRDFLEKLYRALVLEDADMSFCEIMEFRNEPKFQREFPKAINTYNRKELLDYYFSGGLRPVAWNKLYARNLIEEVRYPKGKTSEDVYVILEILCRCNKCVGIFDTCYFYRQRENSILHARATGISNMIEAHKRNYDFASEYIPEYKEDAYQMYLMSHLDAWNKFVRSGGEDEEAETYRRFLKSHLKEILKSKNNSLKRKLLLLLLFSSKTLYGKLYIWHSNKFWRALK